MLLWEVMVFRGAKILALPLLFLIAISACKISSRKQSIVPPADIDTVVRRMSDLMVHDVTNPPLAARFFAYSF